MIWGYPYFLETTKEIHDFLPTSCPFREGACRHGGIDYADATGDEGTTGVAGGFAGDWGDCMVGFHESLTG